MQNKLNGRFPSCLIHCCHTTFRPWSLNRKTTSFCVRSTQTRSYNAKIIQLQSALDDEYNNFSGNINPMPHLRANNWKTFLKSFPVVRSLRSSFIDSFSLAKKRRNTLQGFGVFCFQSCDRLLFLFFFSFSFFFSFFLDFYGNQ